jgi:hypothetical protein
MFPRSLYSLPVPNFQRLWRITQALQQVLHTLEQVQVLLGTSCKISHRPNCKSIGRSVYGQL